MPPTIVGKEPAVDYKANPELDPAFVPDAPDFDAPPAEGDESSKGFGEIMQDRLDKKPAIEKTDAPTKEQPVKEPAKDVTKPATAPVRDVLDAVLDAADPEKPKAEETKSPIEEFENVTDGVKSPEIKKRMVNMRTKLKEFWGQIEQLSKERGELQTKARPALEDPEVKTLLDAKDKELQQAREALLAFDIESSPEFKSEFVEPRNKLARSAAMKLQSYGGNGQELLNALSMPEGIHRDQAIESLTANIPDYAKNKITGFVTQIEQLDEKANEKRANAPQTWEEMNARAIDRQRKAAEKYKSDVTTLYEGITKELAKDPFFRQVGDDVQGSSEWNTGVTGTLQRGLNHILGSDNTIERSLVIAAKGERYDSVAKIALDERARRIAAEKKVAEYEGAQPGFRGSRKPEPKGEDDELKDLPFGEQMARRAAARSEDPD